MTPVEGGKGNDSDIGSMGQFEQLSQKKELTYLIRYYDEVLTQSARNYIFTRDKKWVQRYKKTEPKLDGLLKKILAKEYPENRDLLKLIDKANTELVKMETRCMRLAGNEQIQQALDIIDGAYYLQQKAAYRQNLDDYSRTIDKKLRSMKQVNPVLQFTEELQRSDKLTRFCSDKLIHWFTAEHRKAQTVWA